MVRGGPERVYQLLDEISFSEHPWDLTALGAYDTWENPLSCWVQFLLVSAQPTLLIWGQERTLLFNDAYARTLGVRYPEILGRPFAEVAAPIWGRISDLVEDAFAGRAGVVEDTKLPIWRADDRKTGFYSFAYTPLFSPDGEGPPIGVLCLLTDRTEKIAYKRRLARELGLLHDVYEHAPGFIAMAEGPEHRFKFANAAYRTLVGRQDIIGRTVAEVMPEIERQGFIDLLDRVFQTGVPFVGRALPIEFQSHPNSPPQTRYIDTIYHPVRDAEGTTTGLFAEGHDVTEQVEAESLAAKLQAQLLRVSRSTAMESFGGAVAHELNQPLAAAVNYLAVARKFVGQRDSEADLMGALESASRSAIRASDILRRMRNFTMSGVANSAPTDLLATVLEAVALLRLLDPRISIITTSLEKATVIADGVQVQQVLMNLLKNAQEAMVDVPYPEIEISIRSCGDFAEVSVEDRGPGIPQGRIAELFEWFVTTKSEGTGIGLPISKQIVEAHSGRITAHNGPHGAIFAFTLPLAKDFIADG